MTVLSNIWTKSIPDLHMSRRPVQELKKHCRLYSKRTGWSLVSLAWGVSSCWLRRIHLPCSSPVGCGFNGFGGQRVVVWRVDAHMKFSRMIPVWGKAILSGLFPAEPPGHLTHCTGFGPLHRLGPTSTQNFCSLLVFWWFDNCSKTYLSD